MSLRVIVAAIVTSLLVSIVFSATERVYRRRMSKNQDLRRRLRV